MKRKTIPAREHYADKIEELGFFYHPDYWGEGRYYEFTPEETDRLETATRELYSMACDAAEHIISNNLYAEMRIPEAVRAYINHSWLDDELSVYGRFDLYFDGRDIKLYEFNADTPTSLLESSIIQWNWKEECFPEQDQFNSIHEALVQSWKDIDEQNGIERLFVACSRENEEDLWNLRYMAYTAMEAGLDVAEIDMDQLYYNNGLLLAQSGEVVRDCFKLYPWEWMFNESPEACGARLHWYEPMWKALMSNKMILYTMYLLFPDSPYLLPTWNFLPTSVTRYCRKPILGREGSNVKLQLSPQASEETGGDYGEEGFIFQELKPLPSFEGHHPVIGSWVIGGEPAGIGIRETNGLITGNTSMFVPHIIV